MSPIATTEKLPEPITRPLAPGEATGRLHGIRRRVAEQALGDRPVFVHVRTGTRADVGGWVGRRRVDVFATREGLVLVAAGRFGFEGPRPLAFEASYPQLADSTYNYATGRLALAPAEHCPVRSLKLSPDHAQQLLAQIHHPQG